MSSIEQGYGPVTLSESVDQDAKLHRQYRRPVRFFLSVQARSEAVDQLFKKLDSNRDGKITKNELTQGLESDSVEVGSSCQNSNVDKIFRLLDTGNKGYITRQDAADGLDEIQQPPTAESNCAGKR